MDIKLGSKILVVLSVIAATVLFILGMSQPDSMFGGYNLSWAACTVLWTIGFVCIFIQGLLTKGNVQLRKLYIWVGIIFALAGFLLVINAILGNDWTQYVIPIIVLALGIAALFSIFVGARKKWDQGDNKDPEYKNYHQRKAEAEAKKAAEEKNAK